MRPLSRPKITPIKASSRRRPPPAAICGHRMAAHGLTLSSGNGTVASGERQPHLSDLKHCNWAHLTSAAMPSARGQPVHYGKLIPWHQHHRLTVLGVFFLFVCFRIRLNAKLRSNRVKKKKKKNCYKCCYQPYYFFRNWIFSKFSWI